MSAQAHLRAGQGLAAVIDLKAALQLAPDLRKAGLLPGQTGLDQGLAA